MQFKTSVVLLSVLSVLAVQCAALDFKDNLGLSCNADGTATITFSPSEAAHLMMVDESDLSDGQPLNGCSVSGSAGSTQTMTVDARADMQNPGSLCPPNDRRDTDYGRKRVVEKIITLSTGQVPATVNSMARYLVFCTFRLHEGVIVEAFANSSLIVDGGPNGTIPLPKMQLSILKQISITELGSDQAAIVSTIRDGTNSLTGGRLGDKLALAPFVVKDDFSPYYEFISVDQCQASNNRDFSGDKTVIVLDNKCPVEMNEIIDSETIFEYYGLETERNVDMKYTTRIAMALGFKLFRPDPTNPSLWWRCSVEVCPIDEKDQLCPIPSPLSPHGQCQMSARSFAPQSRRQSFVDMMRNRSGSQMIVTPPVSMYVADFRSNDTKEPQKAAVLTRGQRK